MRSVICCCRAECLTIDSITEVDILHIGHAVLKAHSCNHAVDSNIRLKFNSQKTQKPHGTENMVSAINYTEVGRKASEVA